MDRANMSVSGSRGVFYASPGKRENVLGSLFSVLPLVARSSWSSTFLVTSWSRAGPFLACAVRLTRRHLDRKCDGSPESSRQARFASSHMQNYELIRAKVSESSDKSEQKIQ